MKISRQSLWYILVLGANFIYIVIFYLISKQWH